MKSLLHITLATVLTLWQLPQCLVGWFLLAIYGVTCTERRKYATIVYSKRMRGGISLGRVIILNHCCYDDGWDFDENHEYGHVIQSMMLGPLYLLVVGLPSLIWCAIHTAEMGSYYKFYTERWANRLGERWKD